MNKLCKVLPTGEAGRAEPAGEPQPRLRPTRFEMPDDDMVRSLRKLTGAQRFATADRMYHNARMALLRHLGAEHPDWSSERVVREASRRLSHGTN